MGALVDARSHLDLPRSPLAEQEVTKVIRMLDCISRQMGIAAEVGDAEAREMGEHPGIEALARRLEARLGAPGA